MPHYSINTARFAGSMYNLPAKARRLSMKELDIFETPNRTPPLPPRNPFRRVSDYGKPQPQSSLPVGFSQIEKDLLPKPLLIRRPTTRSSKSSHSSNAEYPSALSPIILPSNASTISSNRSSIVSNSSSRPWTPATSMSGSSAPPSRSCSMRSTSSRNSAWPLPLRPLEHAPPPPPPPPPAPSPKPKAKRTLRRKETPRNESLRSLRAKDSDSRLKREEAHQKKEESRQRKEDSRQKKEEPRHKKEESRHKKEESRSSSSSRSIFRSSSRSSKPAAKSNLGLYSMDAKGVFIMH